MAAVAGLHAVTEQESALAASGVEPQRTWVAEGSLESRANELRWVEQHRSLLT